MTIKITDEQLTGFLDGELPPEDMARIKKAVENDIELQIRQEEFLRADVLWQDAVSATQTGDVPQAVLDMLKEDDVTPVNDNDNLRRWRLPVAASLAFAIGLTVPSFLNSEGTGFDGTVLAGQIQQGNPVYAMLEGTPSAQSVKLGGNEAVTAKPVLTFATSDGSYCREFIISTMSSATRNVACRSDKSWDVLMTSRTRPISESEYQTVSAETDQAIDSLIDNIIDGIPLEKHAEKSLLDTSWKKNN